MTFWHLIRRGLRFHARTHFGVLLGAAIGSAALIGALLVGDSVRGSLRAHALDRLGSIAYALNTGDRFFRQDLVERMENTEVHTIIRSGRSSWIKAGGYASGRTAVLQVQGTAVRQDGAARANQVNVLGIDADSWSRLSQTGMLSRAVLSDWMFAAAGSRASWESGDSVLLNRTLAEQLTVRPGDEIILRLRKPTQLAQDAVISPREGNSIALRLKVGSILESADLGDFSLQDNQTPAANAFVCLQFLAPKLELQHRANLLLSSDFLALRQPTWWQQRRIELADWLARQRSSNRGLWYPDLFSRAPEARSLSWLETHLDSNFSLEDAQLSVRAIEQPQTATGGDYAQPCAEISSSRIFLESNVVAAALRPRTQILSGHFGFGTDNTNDVAANGFVTNGTGILTYLANLIRKDDQATPYSMIAAAQAPLAPTDLRDDEVLINEWLADDLQAGPGDNLQVSYYAVDSASRLIERTNSFKVRAVVPLKGRYADRTLMPEFPGVAKAESTQDWDTGFPLVYKIREKDEAYWKRFRGTPKAFVTLAAGQKMWASRFGSLTAIRYAVPVNSSVQTYRDLAYKNLLANLKPAELGFRFTPVREEALRAAEQGQDFGGLFIGFSLFLVVAALLLMAILFQFSIEQRRTEVGTLLALGFTARQVRWLLLGEGVVLALLGGIVGALLGLGYARLMLLGLTTLWRDAVGGSALHFYASGTSLVSGFCAGTIVAVLTIWLALRKQARQPARELLVGTVAPAKPGKRRWARWVAIGSALCGLGIVGYAVSARRTTDPEAFFEAGSLLLVAGIAWAADWLAKLERVAVGPQLSLTGLGLRGCARRRRRSIATISLLASGCFVTVSIGVFRLDAGREARQRSSGTGGFALIGQAALPVVQDLNSESGRQFFGLSEQDFAGVGVVPFRVHDGDEASCLNLNRAQRPRLLGVRPELLEGRFTFSGAAKGEDIRRGWNLLKGAEGASTRFQPDEVAAIGDANSIEWSLGKQLGDTLKYTDERGRMFKLRLVGAVANSILQGSLIVDEAEFIQRFPSESGYRFFLVDAPAAAVQSLSGSLSRALQDRGLELTPATRRLDQFNAVQNTYLGTFQILGGLGLLLGSAGLGVVVLRNVLERRGELGLLQAVGFPKGTLHWLVLAEHGALLGSGLVLGVVAALVAVLPVLLAPARQLPYLSLSLTLGGVLLNGLVWTWAATRVALRGDLLAALRDE